MAIIKCSECGHDVSTFAEKCQYCGCPVCISSNISDKSELKNNKQYDIILVSCGKHELEAGRFVREANSISLSESIKICENLPQKIISNISLDYANKVKEKLSEIDCVCNIIESNDPFIIDKTAIEDAIEKTFLFTKDMPPICPRCGSSCISTGQRGYSLFCGFLGSNQTVNRCAKCGYSWKP